MRSIFMTAANRVSCLAKKKGPSGFVTYDQNAEPIFQTTDKKRLPLKLQPMQKDSEGRVTAVFSGGEYRFVLTRPISHKGKIAGYVRAVFTPDQNDLAGLQSSLAYKAYLQMPGQAAILPPGIDRNMLKRMQDASHIALYETAINTEPKLTVTHIIDKDFVYKEKHRLITQMMAVAFALAIAAFLLSWQFSKNLILDPLERLKKAIESMRSNDFKKVEAFRDDELGEVIAYFNEVFEKLAKNFALLQSYQKAVDAKNLVLILNTRGEVTFANRNFLEKSGYSLQKLQEKRIHTLIDNTDGIAKTIWKQIRAKNVWQGEMTNRDAKGRTYYTHNVISPIVDKNGQIIEFISIAGDITVQKQQARKLKRLNASLQSEVDKQVQKITQKDKQLQEQAKLAAMGEMIGAIAHQWRQPLNALSIHIQNLDEDYEEGLIDAEFIDGFISKQTETIAFMSKTIDDFRNFFTTDKVKKEFSVKTAARRIKQLLHAQLRNNNIRLCITGEDFILYSYQSEMQQALLNIINNSKDAVIENSTAGAILVALDAHNKRITVKDSGGGVDSSTLPRIFEPYFTTKEQGKGTGIGLHMTRTIIMDHMHGRIAAKNDPKGLTITIDMKPKDSDES